MGYMSNNWAPFAYKAALAGGAALTPYALGVRPSGPYQRTAYGARPQNSLVTSRKKRMPKRNSFKSKVRAVEAAKHFTTDSYQANVLHANINTTLPTAQIVQGDTNSSRDGDEIFLEALRWKGVLETTAVSNGFSYRLMVAWTGEEINTAAGSTANGLTSAEVFLPNTGSNWILGAIPNPKAITILHDQVIDINSLVATTSDLASFDIKVPIKQKFVYQSDGSKYGKTKNLVLIVIGNIIGGTNNSTASGAFVSSYDLIFKNSA